MPKKNNSNKLMAKKNWQKNGKKNDKKVNGKEEFVKKNDWQNVGHSST